ncbi:MAG: glycoside hydrolase family 5 protein [Actinomycetota bacterium]|nr:glycoside hydrolase family 5 protein [Actinomycetota bacterium]
MPKPHSRPAFLRRAGAFAAALGIGLLVSSCVAESGTAGPTPSPEQSAEPTPTPTAERDPLEGVELDALEARRIDELRDFARWLDENQAEGFIGELGWPKDLDAERWNEMAEKWYLVADSEGLWTTVWATGTAWSDDYRLTVYDGPVKKGLNSANPQAEVLERRLDGDLRHGVNVAGLDFGTDREDFSSANPGVLGQNYFAEVPESYEYLASRGIDLVRLPFRWERVQAEPFGELEASGVKQVRDELDAAAAAGIDVILDLHNYGRYASPEGELQVGTDALPTEAFIDVWLRLAEEFGDHPAVDGYGLMNEPNNFSDAGGFASPAELWETVTQRTLTALREAGDETLVLVGGYDWSGVEGWREIHPDGWISDPADNFRYEAHHYWDSDATGTYTQPYADVVAHFAG